MADVVNVLRWPKSSRSTGHNKPNKLQYNARISCRNKCVFSFRRNTSKDDADVMSSGRVFQSLGPATANERSPTVTSHDRGMTTVQRRLTTGDSVLNLDVMSETQCSRSDRYQGVPKKSL